MSIPQALLRDDIPRNEAYIEVRRRWAFSDSLYCRLHRWGYEGIHQRRNEGP
jgi:hypothetical protein